MGQFLNFQLNYIILLYLFLFMNEIKSKTYKYEQIIERPRIEMVCKKKKML